MYFDEANSIDPVVNQPTPTASGVNSDLLRDLWDTNKVAEFLGVSPRQVRRLVDRGQFPAGVKLGVLRRWDPKVVQAFMSEKNRLAQERGAA